MTTHTFAHIRDGKLHLEAEVIPAIVTDDDRRLIFVDHMMRYATKAQQEVYAMLDSDVVAEIDMIYRRMRANSK